MTPRPVAAGLGKGLGSLIPLRARTPQPGDPSIREVPVSAIVANPFQPRQAFTLGFEELVASIRSHGILQPLVVQPRGGQFELIAGERRLRAARQLGLKRVPVIVRSVSRQQQLELALVENLQRQDLNPLEEAEAYQRLIDEFNLTQEAVGQRVGKSRSYVANVIRLRSLPESILQSLAKGEITEGHAKVLLGLPTPEDQLKLWREIVRRHLPVRGLEQIRGPKRPKPNRDAELVEVAERLQTRYQTRVAITRRHGRGTIRFDYYSSEEFRSLVRRLLEGKD